MSAKIITALVILSIFGITLYFYGDAREGEGAAKERAKMASQVSEIAKKHAIELAKAIEKTRQQEVAFHAKLSKLQTVKDSTGCLDRALPPEFIERLRDTYPDQRRPAGGTLRAGPLTRWGGNATPDR